MNYVPQAPDEMLIVGHGLAGCTLAMTCYRMGLPFKMVGSSMPGEASMASSGLIAPITGRRYVKAWRIDEFVPKALDFYSWTEDLLGGKYFFPVEIVRYLSNPEFRNAWNKRLEDPEYQAYISDKTTPQLDQRDRPYGILTGGYRLDTPEWIIAVRSFLEEKGLLTILDQLFVQKDDPKGIIIYATGAVDKAIAKRIIPNKGESLLVRMPGWSIREIIKDDVFVIPLHEDGLYWVGSYYEPWPEHPEATLEGRERLVQSLTKIYPGKFEIVRQMVGVRPTVNDRRPLIGLLPGTLSQYIFNGMGTKGTSLAPFWAEQLLLHITQGMTLPEDVHPDRYIP